MATKKKVEEKNVEATPEIKSCADKHCPICRLKTHGRVFEGVVVSDKMQRTVVVRWDRQKYIPKYERYLKLRSKVSAHNSPCLGARKGNKVRIAECRPISKTVSFAVIEVLE